MPDILPDSRPRESKDAQRRITRIGSQNWIPIYCANCGREGGRVPEENMRACFWLCDNCFEKHGPIAATMAIADEVFWAKVADDQRDKQER